VSLDERVREICLRARRAARQIAPRSTKDKDTADLGPVNITVTDKEHVHVPTPVSVGAIVLGVVLLFAGRRPRTA